MPARRLSVGGCQGRGRVGTTTRPRPTMSCAYTVICGCLVGRSHVGVSCTRPAVHGGLATHRVRVPPGQPEVLGLDIGPGKKGKNVLTRRLHAYACEGADENSCQSRPRYTVLSPTLGRLPPPRETAADLARVMLVMDDLVRDLLSGLQPSP